MNTTESPSAGLSTTLTELPRTRRRAPRIDRVADGDAGPGRRVRRPDRGPQPDPRRPRARGRHAVRRHDRPRLLHGVAAGAAARGAAARRGRRAERQLRDRQAALPGPGAGRRPLPRVRRARRGHRDQGRRPDPGRRDRRGRGLRPSPRSSPSACSGTTHERAHRSERQGRHRHRRRPRPRPGVRRRAGGRRRGRRGQRHRRRRRRGDGRARHRRGRARDRRRRRRSATRRSPTPSSRPRSTRSAGSTCSSPTPACCATACCGR